MTFSEIPSNILSEISRLYADDEPAPVSHKSAWRNADTPEKEEARSKVLVVDDQRLIADTLAEILGNAGFDAVAAYDGFDALDKASRFRPQWVLTDVLMPRMNGVELAIAVRKNYPDSAILLFSGQAGISEILQEGHRQGYQFELIAKPIHPMRLIERLKEDPS
jgi:CheY-like chemotaxis protein